MASNIALPTDFTETIKDRLRTSIGELLPDEVLSQMIEKTLAESLTETRTIRTNPDSPSYHAHYEEKPPLLVELVTPLVEEAIKTEVEEWFKSNEGEIQVIIEESLKTLGEESIKNAIKSMLSNSFETLKMNLAKDLSVQIGPYS